MEQQQFKIKMSLSSKLLLLITILLMALIAILNISAIKLFSNDKQAYIYESQATSAALAGREFATGLQDGLDTLKLIMGSADVSAPIEGNAKNNIAFILDNQRSFTGVEIFSVSPETFAATRVLRYFSAAALEQVGMKDTDLNVEQNIFQEMKTELLANGYYFRNVSKSGQNPFILTVYADLNTAKTKGYIPVAIGFWNLKPYYSGATRSFNRTAIIDKNGKLLFHTDPKEIYSAQDYGKDEFFKESLTASTVSGAKEYTASNGTKMLASYYKPGLSLIAMNSVEYEKAMKSTYTLTEHFVMYAFGALGLMMLAAYLFAKKLTAPIQRLYVATGQVADGNFEINLPVSSTDEIGALTNSFMSMSRKIVELIQQMLDKMRVDQELQIAQTVQQSLFPQSQIIDEHINLSSHFVSASECGGDWWGYFRHGNKHYISIADATGHGLPSALITASARSCFSVIEKLVTTNKFSSDPAEMLTIANRVIYDSAQGKIMMTFFVAVIDFDTRTLSYASAAHNPPWVFSPQPDNSYKMASLVAKGMRLGESRDATGYETKTIQIAPKDTIVFYTDGLLEGKNLEGTQYGKKLARKILEENMGKQPSQVIDALITDFMNYNTGKNLDDDVTLAIMRVN